MDLFDNSELDELAKKNSRIKELEKLIKKYQSMNDQIIQEEEQ